MGKALLLSVRACLALLAGGLCTPSWGSMLVLTDVPAYDWYHGCGPTAAASVLGYWDLHGYPDLFTASGPEVYLTANVQDQISSPEHNAKYDPTPDRADLPAPPDTSIADFFHTSEGSGMGLGWSYQRDADDAFVGYAGYRGYNFSSSYRNSTNFTWQSFVAEINAGRPLMFLVDTDGNNSTDHFVPVFGYYDGGEASRYYAMYTTWSEDETVAWAQFRYMDTGVQWGVAYGTFVSPLDAPVPEPATGLLVTACLAGLLRMNRFRRR